MHNKVTAVQWYTPPNFKTLQKKASERRWWKDKVHPFHWRTQWRESRIESRHNLSSFKVSTVIDGKSVTRGETKKDNSLSNKDTHPRLFNMILRTEERVSYDWSIVHQEKKNNLQPKHERRKAITIKRDDHATKWSKNQEWNITSKYKTT